MLLFRRKLVLGFVAILLACSAFLFILPSVSVFAAGPPDAYWVGDSGNWTDDTNHWALVSGGAPGLGNKPGTSTTAHLDSLSFTIPGQSILLENNEAYLNLDCTGVTNSPTLTIPAGAQFYAFGDYTTLAAGMSFNGTGVLVFNGLGAPHNNVLTTNGVTIGPTAAVQAGSKLVLGDNATFTSLNLWATSSIDTDDKTLTCNVFAVQGADSTLDYGSSIVNINTSWAYNSANLTFAAGTSSIRMAGTASFNAGTGLTFNDVQFNGSAHTIAGSGTYNTLTLLDTATQTLTFTDGTTQTATTFALTGSVGHIHTFYGTGVAGWNLSQAAGTVNVDYVKLYYSNAGGGATFNANGTSVNGGGNVGWNFPLTISTQAATSISMDKDGVTSVVLNGTLTDMGGSTTDTIPFINVGFEYGPTLVYGSSTANISLPYPETFTFGNFAVHQIYCMGDSLTYNGTYEAKLESLLGSTWNTNNKGVPGEAVNDMVNRFATDIMVPGDCEYLIVWGGINSVRYDQPEATIESLLQLMYTTGHNAGYKVISINITPYKGFIGWNAAGVTKINNINTWIATTAVDVDYKIDAFSLLVDPANPDTLLPAYDSGDHLHLSTTGYDVVGSAVFAGSVWNPVIVGIPTNLTPGGTYHFRAVAYNSGVVANGADQTFTYTMPTIATGTATNVGMGAGTYATLNGAVSNMGVASGTYGNFEWGYNIAYGHTVVSHTILGVSSVSDTIVGFDPNGVVHYRFNTENGGVTVYGADQTFSITSSSPSSPSFVAFNFANGVVPVLFVAFIIFIVMALALGGAVSPLMAIILMAVAILMGTAFLQGIQALLNAMWGG